MIRLRTRKKLLPVFVVCIAVVFGVLRSRPSEATSSLRAENHGVHNSDGRGRALSCHRSDRHRGVDEAGDRTAVLPQRMSRSDAVSVAAAATPAVGNHRRTDRLRAAVAARCGQPGGRRQHCHAHPRHHRPRLLPGASKVQERPG